MFRNRKDIQLRDNVIPLSKHTCLMGVLNVTPDSFSDGGRFRETVLAVERAKIMRDQGAHIIDIGGESSRPGAESVPEEEEIKRVVPVIREIKKNINIPLSVDTYKSGVAVEALKNGADMVNDITGLKGDPVMAEVIADFDAGVVLMHMKGTPGTMQEDPIYDDVIENIYQYLLTAVNYAEKKGIDPEKIIVDPGIGFGKTVEHNILILKNLNRFKELGKPVLIGTSRKSFIGKITGKEVGDRIFGTAASVAAAILNGADIVRIHDVSQMLDVVKVIDAVKSEHRSDKEKG
ncbi:MAG: dihydropteroate synthase [Candidatus Omnitrophota bacterium]